MEGFCFEYEDKDVQFGFRRIATEQIEKALKESHIVAQDNAHTIIHSVRKCCKRLRALIRIVRFSFTDYPAANAAIGDLARRLSQLRDASVLPETLANVVECSRQELKRAEVARLSKALKQRARRLKTEQDETAALCTFRDGLAVVRERVDEWRLERTGLDAIADGFGYVYRRGRRDMRRIVYDPSFENYHDWRKQVRYHYYHLCLLRTLAPHVMESQRELVNDLAEILGKHHDAAVLLHVLVHQQNPFDTGQAERFKQSINDHMKALGAHALQLGREVYAERTGRIVERVGSNWNWSGKRSDGRGPRDRAQVSRAA